MTVCELAQSGSLEIVTKISEPEREVALVYCCDLLSFVMGCAPADSAWVTVMGNINAVAVAHLTDMACIVLAENAILDEDAQKKAEQNNVTILRSSAPIFETAFMIHQLVARAAP